MINLGNSALYITLFISILTSLLIRSKKTSLIYRLIFLQFVFLTIALMYLVLAYITSDFSLVNVLRNSHELTPTLYKITGVWSNHEGSMLLWLWLLSTINIIFMINNKFSTEDTGRILSIQSLIVSAFLLFIIFTSNPFLISNELFPNSKGFNPLLQDIGLSIHPPILYAGYTGFSIVFSATLIALLYENYNKAWLQKLHIWIILPWSLLTLGIGLGGWWAYRELGWGGFWFWDPVENVSLILWLIATSLLHTLKISINNNKLYSWTCLLSIGTFLISILGMLLVRSGILSSVHSFALDLYKGVFLSIILISASIISIFIFIRNKRKLTKLNIKIKLNKETALFTSSISLMLINVIIIAGIFYPLIYQYLHDKIISVNESYYTKTISVILIPTIIITTIHAASNIKNFLYCTIAATAFTTFLHIAQTMTFLTFIYLVISISLTLCLIKNLLESWKKLSTKYISMLLAHIGFSLLMVGGSLYYAWEFDTNFLMKANDKIQAQQYTLILNKISYGKQANYLFRRAHIDIEKNNQIIGSLIPEIRFYPIEKNFTYESSILHSITGDIYLTIGELDKDHKINVEFKYRPFIYLIWLSILLMSSSVIIYSRKLFNKK